MAREVAITDLLVSVAEGDTSAQQELFRRVYDELRRIARAHVRKSAHGLTINPTTLVHETWIKFSRFDKSAVAGSAHFYNIVAQAMRQILIDLIAKKQTVKHGGALVRAELTDRIEEEEKPLDELVAIHGALDELQACDPELGSIVEWHYFAGLSVSEIAEKRDVSERTVKRHLAMARAFLHDAIKGKSSGSNKSSD